MSNSFEKTLAIIGAKGLLKLPDILQTVRNSGLSILYQKRFQLRKNQVQYMSTHIFKDLNSVFIEQAVESPVQILIIGGNDSVSKWLELIGKMDPSDNIHVRGSPNFEAAAREIRYFLPETRFESDLGMSGRKYLSETVYAKLLEGLVLLSKTKPPIPVLWLAEWLLENRPHEQ